MGFGDDFLAKRYAAGREEGRGEGRAEGREEGVEIRNVQLLEFLEEHPEATAKDVEEWARSRDGRRNGKAGGAAGKD